jgi:metallo-beta-lactamase family protein
MPTLTFLGAARTVTGSKYLLDTGRHQVLFDCGLFQGLKELRQRNWAEFPVRASEIDAIVLTHAHLDHCGYLPKLVSLGFEGRVFCTSGTSDLCRLVLPDSARIQEEDARQANRHGYSRHRPALPLYTSQDAHRALELLQPVGYDRAMPVAPGIQVTFKPAGHLLGSAWVQVALDGPSPLTIVFGGDLGRYGRPVLPDPVACTHADVLLVESTYGNREHVEDDDAARLGNIVRRTAERGGKLIIPSFAIGRVEEVLYWLKTLEDSRSIPVLPVYVDSPMALEALEFYRNRSHELDPDVRPARGEVCAFCTRRFEPVDSPERSKEIMRAKGPSIIISASGMATGGRVLHHLAHGLDDEKNTVAFVGFQAPGTRGRSLVDGASQVKIHGRLVAVAADIEKIDTMSAHADQSELLRWLGAIERPPRQTFLVHGEPEAMSVLQARIRDSLGWEAAMPHLGETVTIG